VPTDEKNRPSVPVVITNCGELELRRAPEQSGMEGCIAQDPSFRISLTHLAESRDAKERKKAKKRQSRSRSRSPRLSKKSKSKGHGHSEKKSQHSENGHGDEETRRAETEEEYDARLEREEKERIEAQRKAELERVKRKYEESASSSNQNGVRFKGAWFLCVEALSRCHRTRTDIGDRSWTHEVHRSRVTKQAI
jgi:peptidyl-prolyl isomerase G (cyclophilin G)